MNVGDLIKIKWGRGRGTGVILDEPHTIHDDYAPLFVNILLNGSPILRKCEDVTVMQKFEPREKND